MNKISESIMRIGIVPVIKLTKPERDAKPLAQALSTGDVPVAEVTFRSNDADTSIRLMSDDPDLRCGI